MSKGVLILTEAGKDIGFGHYTRCSAIREKLVEVGINAKMIIFLNDYDLKDEHIIRHDWLTAPENLLSDNSYSVVLIDSYLANETIYIMLSQAFRSVIAIDDYNRILYPTQYVLNPNVFFSKNLYKNQKAKCIGGKDYVILRKDFRENNISFDVRIDIKNVLITIGGSDFRKILPMLTDTCLKWNISKLKIISPEIITNGINDDRLEILPAQDAKGMVQLIGQADLVISACGQTLHELVSLAKPTIGICLDVDQVPNREFYLNGKFLLSSINWDDDDIADKLFSVFNIMSECSVRMEIQNNCQSLINKNGVEQIVKVIKQVL